MLRSDAVILCHCDYMCPTLLHQEVIVWKMQLSNNFDMIMDQKYCVCEMRRVYLC